MMVVTRRAVTLFAMLAAGPAWACKVRSRPQVIVNEPYDAAIEVTIAQVTRGPALLDDWQAVGSRSRVFFGVCAASRFEFGPGEVVGSCEDPLPAPPVGEKWVLYLVGDEAAWRVARYYPLRMARAFDPRIVDP
jgi:hypothetical protein